VSAPSTVVGRATLVKSSGTPDPNTSSHSSKPSKSKSSHDPAKVVHHSESPLAHLIQQVGKPKVAVSATSSTTGSDTTMGLLGAVDQALNQLGTSRRQHHP
jgi:hypothetical protein